MGALDNVSVDAAGALGEVPAPSADGALSNLYEKAQQQYPKIPRNVAYKENFGGGPGFLEYYPKGETDSFDPSRPAMQVFSPKTRPIDIAGDLASHHMTDSDPVVGQAYRKFLMSMQPWQQQHLQRQYEHATKNEGEDRPFKDWAEASGQPAYFRGYAFDQWGPEAKKMYTPEQIKMFDDMTTYLKGAK